VKSEICLPGKEKGQQNWEGTESGLEKVEGSLTPFGKM
jgi:hypothetical protein